MAPQIVVYLVGATGRTGTSIADALLDRADQFVSYHALSDGSNLDPPMLS